MMSIRWGTLFTYWVWVISAGAFIPFASFQGIAVLSGSEPWVLPVFRFSIEECCTGTMSGNVTWHQFSHLCARFSETTVLELTHYASNELWDVRWKLFQRTLLNNMSMWNFIAKLALSRESWLKSGNFHQISVLLCQQALCLIRIFLIICRTRAETRGCIPLRSGEAKYEKQDLGSFWIFL